MNRAFVKTDYLYSTDKEGYSVQIYTKKITTPAQVAAGGNIAIQLSKPSGATKVITFMVDILTDLNVEYFAVATTYTLANNVLTITVPVGGTAIPAGSAITIIYTVGV